MFTKQHVQQNKEMLAVARGVTAQNYDRDGTPSFHNELESKVFEALVGFGATKERKRSVQAKALRVHRGVVTQEREQNR